MSRVLRIRPAYLQAIEDGRFQELPGPTYVTGFIRAYAEHLGLDADEVVRRYKDEESGVGGRPQLDFLDPISERGIPGGALVFVGVLIAVLAYGGWYLSTVKQGLLADLIPPLPERFAALIHHGEGTSSEAGELAAPETPPSPNAATAAPVEEAAPNEAAPETMGGAAPAEETATAAPSPPTTVAPQPEPAAQPVAAAPPQPTPPAEPAESRPTAAPETAPAAPVATDTAPREAPPATTPSVAEGTAPAPAPAATEPKPAPVERTAAEARPAAAADSAGLLPPQPPASPSMEGSAATKPAAELAAVIPPPPPETEPATAATDTATSTAESPQVASLPEASDAAANTPTGRVFGSENKDARIVIRARLDSWVQVRDGPANRLLLIRLLRAGDSYRVPDRPGLKLQTGNAGALEIFVDGKRVPDIGPVGSVRRDVALNVQLLKSGNAVLDR